MSLRSVFWIAVLAAAVAGIAVIELNSSSPYIPDMNWVGENPDGAGPPALFMFINFAIFAGLILRFGRPALRRYMESRHTLIKDALEEASRIRAEAKAKLEEYSQRIADVDSEVDTLISEVRADAEAEKERIIEEGRQHAERLKRDAEARISAEFARARQDIEREVVVAAVAAAEKLLREKASPQDKSAFVDDFIAHLESGGAESDVPSPPKGAS